MRTYALDFETYYDAVCSVVTLGIHHYTRHPEFDAYLLTVCGDDGFEYCGRPEDLDWSLIAGEGTRWVHHNASFDAHILYWLRETGKIPASAEPEEWCCTADMCAYFGYPRSLAGAVGYLFGLKPDKSVRDKMKGRKFNELNAADNQELLHYAIDDAKLCLRLWTELSPRYPWAEQVLSTHTAMMGWDGLPMDVDGLDRGISHVGDQIWNAEQSIPWTEDSPTLSPKALAAECRKVGIEPPKSLAKDSEECAAWEDRYGEQYPWINAMRTYRRCNALKKKMETMRSRIKDDGRMAFGLKFFGGHTGRWSGDSGANLQNLPRGEMFGVNLRNLIKCQPGRTFVVCDLAQIEPRVLAWLAGDEKLLESLRNGFGVYTAFARANNLWQGETDSLKKDDAALYQFCKASVLGLGYMVGPNKFTLMAPQLTGGAFAPTLAEAETIVAEYRRRNTAVTGLWKRLEAAIRRSVMKDLTIDLPSGRTMTWRKVTSIGGNTCETMRGGRYVRSKVYAGMITENITQATARDVLAWQMLELLKLGHDIVLHVHDEIVIECDESAAEAVKATMIEVMSTTPPWLPGLVLGAEADITPVYTK